MNCFEWQNRVSDFLDGTLIGTPKREADEHLDSCKTCSEQHKRYRLILTSIASQPRSMLPVPIRKAPFAAALPRLNIARLSRSHWEQLPWWLRTTLEGTSIVFLILLGISAGPRIRALYERNIERNLSEFNDVFNRFDSAAENVAHGIPLSRGKPLPLAQGEIPSTLGSTSEGDEFASEGNEDETADEGTGGDESVDGEVHVGSSEIWRFNLKTDSPHEIRPKIVQLLTDLRVPAGTTGLGGIEAPGGIQFDLLLTQSIVLSLKKQLQKLAPPTPEGLLGTAVGEPFTWYKNRSKNPIPDGYTKVVIWLSQM